MTALGRWFRSLRPYSFPASLMPTLLGIAVAIHTGADIDWWTLPLYALSALLFHAGTNVLNDYYDYLHGVDVPGDPDPTHVITQGLVKPRFMLVSGNLYFFLGVVFGSIIAASRGWLFWAVGLTGASLAYFYTNRRFSLKYKALGDVAVFLLMGPALVFLCYWALTGRISLQVILYALPIAFLVTAILHGNNTRDIDVDRNAQIDTLAGRLGFEPSKWFFVALIGLAYVSLLPIWWSSSFGWQLLLPVFSLPLALVISRRVLHARRGAYLMELPLWASGVHLVFSLLYSVGFLL